MTVTILGVWLWEPILNETWYPEDFAGRVKGIVDEEYPYPSCYSGCDVQAKGSQYFPVQFAHPMDLSKRDLKLHILHASGEIMSMIGVRTILQVAQPVTGEKQPMALIQAASLRFSLL